MQKVNAEFVTGIERELATASLSAEKQSASYTEHLALRKHVQALTTQLALMERERAGRDKERAQLKLAVTQMQAYKVCGGVSVGAL